MLSDDLTGQQQRQTLASGSEPEALDNALSADPTLASPAAVAAEPGYLLFRCAGVDCAVPLVALREVLPLCPSALPLPHSPEWLLGVFALRAELVGLADPAPLLFGTPGGRPGPQAYGAALLAGNNERVLAWAVESIGATAPLEQEAGEASDGDQPAMSLGEMPPDTLEALGALEAPGQAIVATYGVGEIATSGTRCAVINVGALLADMLHALEERPADG